MATNPYFTQYHTQRFSFIGSPQQRDGTYLKDQRFVNMYPELIKSPITDGKKYYLKKRPGFAPSTFNFAPGSGRGLFFWNNNFYFCVGSQLYRNSTAIQTLTTSTGPVGFVEFRGTSSDQLIFVDGTKGYVIPNVGFPSLITSANFPTPHVPNPIFLDGYLCLAGSGSQTIFNSDLGNPFGWTSGNAIDAEMYPDQLVGLAKVQNYIAAIGQQSIEWFYDNANATGSPLQRNAPAVSQFGCPAPLSINQTEKELILVGQTGNGGRTIWIVDGFQPTEIANEPIREALDLEGTSIGQATAVTVQVAGHKFYILNLYLNQRTFVYDFEEKMWHEWTGAGPGQNVIPYPVSCDTGNGFPLFLHGSTGQCVNLSPTFYTDNGESIFCTVITSKIDFDSIKRKRFFRLSLIADSPGSGNSAGANFPVTVSWSDDDYNTFTPGTVLSLNGSYPTITQLGFARRRSFKFVYQEPFPLRMESFEVDIIQEVRR